ncbi:septum formation family protein [Streptomyces sp. NPDC002644]
MATEQHDHPHRAGSPDTDAPVVTAPLSRVRETERRGRGMAIAGIALFAVGALLTVLVLTTGVGADLREGVARKLGLGAPKTAAIALEPGDCFDERAAPEDADLETHEVPDVDKASCDDPHDGEAYARFDLPAGSYPGEDEVAAVVDERCAEKMHFYSPDAWKLYAHAAFGYYYPAQEDWARGERGAVCVFTPASTGDRLTGSLRQDGSALDPHQRAYLEAAGQVNAALAQVPVGEVEEEYLGAYQWWASDVSSHLWLLAAQLRDHDWEEAEEPIAARLADQADLARQEWDELKETESVDDFTAQCYVAEQALADHAAGTAFTLRESLGLSTGRPITTEYQYPRGEHLL